MRLASYKARGRTSFGVVDGDGVIDLRLRLGARFPTLLDVMRAGRARRRQGGDGRGVRPDFPLVRGRTAAAGAGAGKNPLHRHQLQPRRRVQGPEPARDAGYCSMFFRTPGSLVGHNQPILLPPESEQLDYEGEVAIIIGKEGSRIPKERALELHHRLHAVQRRLPARLDAARQVQRHARQELRRLGQPRPVDRHGRRTRPDEQHAPDDQGQRRGPAGHHHLADDARRSPS